MDRRKFLRNVGLGAMVVGFDLRLRGWVTAEAAYGASQFDGVPPLDGTLTMDDQARLADGRDKGNIVFDEPAAVLRPASVADIAAMIRFCRARGIKVARRGQGHTTFGQSLSPGLVIEHGTLTKIHSITPAGADVDAGVLWHDLIRASYGEGLTPPAITGYTKLSVGGTLSVGGVPGIAGSTHSGCQIDRVQALQVVTGTGDVVDCSLTQNRDLFEAMLGGLGQCGVITRATVDLVPAKKRARSYLLHYANNATFFADLRLLLDRADGLDQIYNQCFPPGTAKIYQLNAVRFYDGAHDAPNDLALLRGVHTVPVIDDLPYLDYLFVVDAEIDTLRATVHWDRLVKPWFDVWLSDSQVEQFVGQALRTLHPDDVGFGYVLVFPVKRSRITRQFFPVPGPDGNGWVYLFDILTASTLPGPNTAFIRDKLARNRQLYDQARSVGATRYCIGSIPFEHADWVAQYGNQWSAFRALKQHFDPDGILTPGPGIFTP